MSAVAKPADRPTADPATAAAIGSIITAVAVFEIHMLANADTNRKASTVRRGSVPTIRSVTKANRRCSSQRSSVAASRNPPRKRKITGSAYATATARSVPRPATGSTTSGSRAVASRGITALSHQNAIQSAIPATSHASGANTPGAGDQHRHQEGERTRDERDAFAHREGMSDSGVERVILALRSSSNGRLRN